MTQNIMQIGQVSWTNKDIQNSLTTFVKLLQNKPFQDNDGGMKAPHLFATWFLIKQIKPKFIIESGVWKGLGTWLIAQAAPDAQIICIEPYPDRIIYRPTNTSYQTIDFTETDWSTKNIDFQNTLLFFDDHQNCFERLKLAKKFGFRHLIFEDNYPASRGDCYSLKKAFMYAGFTQARPKTYGRYEQLKALLFPPKVEKIPKNKEDEAYLIKNCEIYYEFPPIFKTSKTRWEDEWEAEKYPSPNAIIDKIEDEILQIFEDEAQFYTWLCYCKCL